MYLSTTKAIHLAGHHNLPTLCNSNQAATTNKIWFVQTYNFLLEIVKIFHILRIVLNSFMIVIKLIEIKGGLKKMMIPA